jgi:hypothetical protein
MSEDFKCQADDFPRGDAVSPSALQSDDSEDAGRAAMKIWPIVNDVMDEISDKMHKCFEAGEADRAEGWRLRLEGAARVAQKLGMLVPIEEEPSGDDEPPLQAQHQPDIEKANDIMDEACLGEPWVKNGVDAALRVAIAAALRAERERCARFVENWPHVHPNVSSSIAKAIRTGDTHV